MNNRHVSVIFQFSWYKENIKDKKGARKTHRKNPKSTFWPFSVHFNTIICHHYPASGEHTYAIMVGYRIANFITCSTNINRLLRKKKIFWPSVAFFQTYVRLQWNYFINLKFRSLYYGYRPYFLHYAFHFSYVLLIKSNNLRESRLLVHCLSYSSEIHNLIIIIG